MQFHKHPRDELVHDKNMPYDAILQKLPAIDFAFAYGSGVFGQDGYSDHEQKEASRGVNDQLLQPGGSTPSANMQLKRPPMLDLVVAVRNPIEWHRENLERNWKDYSILRYLGAERLGQIQEDYGAALYYNTALPVPGHPNRVMKYGIISTHALRRDLVDWQWMYAAGRMQKPVKILKAYEALAEAQRTNLTSAVRAALLLLPESFSDFDLFTMIAGLSYRGDFRMTFGENPRKVKNIVTSNLPHFHELYSPVLATFSSLTAAAADKGRFSQDLSPRVRASHLRQLPMALRQYLVPRKLRDIMSSERSTKIVHSREEGDKALRDAWEQLSGKKTSKMVKLAIHKVVARSSLTQGLKGVFTAGVWKALVYSLHKMNKYRIGMGKSNPTNKM